MSYNTTYRLNMTGYILESQKKCVNCNKIFSNEFNHCPHCGNVLNSDPQLNYDTQDIYDLVFNKILEIRKNSKYFCYGIADNESLCDIGGCSWYDYKKDMLELSRHFPFVLFEIYGEGEESGDIWKHYFENGKSQRCEAKIVFDEYNESKLE